MKRETEKVLFFIPKCSPSFEKFDLPKKFIFVWIRTFLNEPCLFCPAKRRFFKPWKCHHRGSGLHWFLSETLCSQPRKQNSTALLPLGRETQDQRKRKRSKTGKFQLKNASDKVKETLIIYIYTKTCGQCNLPFLNSLRTFCNCQCVEPFFVSFTHVFF